MKLNKKRAKNVMVGILLVLVVASPFLIPAYSRWAQDQKSLNQFLDYAKQYARECGLDGVTAGRGRAGKVSIVSDSFQSLSNPDKLKTMNAIQEKLNQAVSLKKISRHGWEIVSGEDYYEVLISSSFCKELYRNGVRVYSPISSNSSSSSSSSSKPSSNSTQAKTKKTCPFCQGTGKVRYYVGGSALEAALNGYEDFYMGPCSSCGGTGYYYE